MGEKYKGYIRIGVDMDGVLADFKSYFSKLLCNTANVPCPKPFNPKSFQWYYEIPGITKEHVNTAWDILKTNPGSWEEIPDLPNSIDDLNLLTQRIKNGDDVYFITSRPYPFAKFHTERWLQIRGIDNPTVLVAEEKGPLAKSLKLDFFLDDRDTNCYNVLRFCGVRTRVFIMKASYNSLFNDPYVHKVGSVKEMLSYGK